MAYANLIAAWNAGGVPAGYAGTAIAGGMTTQQKVDAVNSWTIVTPIPAAIAVSAIINAIDPADFAALMQLQVSKLALLFMGGTSVNALPNIRADFQAIFAGKPTTLANLSALVAPFDNHTTLWTANNGYSQITLSDALAAGLT